MACLVVRDLPGAMEQERLIAEQKRLTQDSKAAKGLVPTKEEWMRKRVDKYEYTKERTTSLF